MKSYLTKIKANEDIVLQVIPEEEKLVVNREEVTEEEAVNDEAHPIVGLLQAALMGEYQQWDLYTSYASRLKGESRNGVAEEFKHHAEEELEHIELIQRYITSMGEVPTTHRKHVPEMPEDATVQHIVEMQIAFEKDAVELYQKIIKLLDAEEHAALKVDLETIMSKEMEHAQELELMLDQKPEVMAGLMFIPEEAGEPTKPQAGYGCGCKCGGDCNCGPSCKCQTTYVDKINNHWCMLALKELSPDLYARWSQGQKMTDAEKAYVLKAFQIKSVLKDPRAINRFIESL